MVLFFQAAENSSDFVDGQKRSIEVPYLGGNAEVTVSSYQDEVLCRFSTWAKEMGLRSGKIVAYPWEAHFTKPGAGCAVAQEILADTKKASF